MTPTTTTSSRSFVWRSLLGSALLMTVTMPLAAQTSAEREGAPKPFAAMSASAQTLRDSLVRLARAQIGTKYVAGGQSPDRGFDCSGFVKYVMQTLHVSLPRTAQQQSAVGTEVSRDIERLRPGDLLTFGKSKRSPVSHIGIYIGNGKFVHASSGAGEVVVSNIGRTNSSLVRAWQGARRLMQLSQSDTKPSVKPFE